MMAQPHFICGFTLLLMCSGCGSAPARLAPPAHARADRDCRPHLPQSESGDGREVERCALNGNLATVRAKADDMHSLRLSVELRESVSGCGELSFNIAALYPSGRTYERQATAQCEEVCVEGGAEQETGCYDAALKTFSLTVTFEQPLPGFTLDGSPVNGSIPVTLSSSHGSFEKMNTVARVKPE